MRRDAGSSLDRRRCPMAARPSARGGGDQGVWLGQPATQSATGSQWTCSSPYAPISDKARSGRWAA